MSIELSKFTNVPFVQPQTRATARQATARPATPVDAATKTQALLTRLLGDRVRAPAWLEEPVETLAAAGRAERPLGARLADVIHMLTQVEQLATTRLPEVHAWFQSVDEPRLSLTSALPQWTEILLAEASVLVRGRLLPELAAAGVEVRPIVQVDEWQRAWLHRYFMQRVYPLLTPLAVDPGRPFPYISSESINLLVELRRPEAARNGARSELYARVKIPPATPRLAPVPTHQAHLSVHGAPPAKAQLYVCSADLVRFFVHHLFTGMPVRHVYLFRVVRGDMPLAQPDAPPAGRHRRHQDRPVVRLDVERRMAEPVLQWLLDHLVAPTHCVVRHESLLEWMCVPHLHAQLQATSTHQPT
jgi:polyphosphate kinase